MTPAISTNNTSISSSTEQNVTDDSEQQHHAAASTPFQIGIGLLILGASAGLTLYTKKTQAMLNQMKRMEENRAMRLPKKKFGPPTKKEWEKLRNRWTNDDL
jgi:hypothetical protein